MRNELEDILSYLNELVKAINKSPKKQGLQGLPVGSDYIVPKDEIKLDDFVIFDSSNDDFVIPNNSSNENNEAIVRENNFSALGSDLESDFVELSLSDCDPSNNKLPANTKPFSLAADCKQSFFQKNASNESNIGKDIFKPNASMNELIELTQDIIKKIEGFKNKNLASLNNLSLPQIEELTKLLIPINKITNEGRRIVKGYDEGNWVQLSAKLAICGCMLDLQTRKLNKPSVRHTY